MAEKQPINERFWKSISEQNALRDAEVAESQQDRLVEAWSLGLNALGVPEKTALRDAEMRKSSQERFSEAQYLGEKVVIEDNAYTGRQGQAGEETASLKPLKRPPTEPRHRSSKTHTGLDNLPDTLQDQIREAQSLIENLYKELYEKNQEIKLLRTELERIQKFQVDAIKEGRFADVGDWETKYRLQSQVLERSEEEKRVMKGELDEAENRELELRRQLRARGDMERAVVTPAEVSCGGKCGAGAGDNKRSSAGDNKIQNKKSSAGDNKIQNKKSSAGSETKYLVRYKKEGGGNVARPIKAKMAFALS